MSSLDLRTASLVLILTMWGSNSNAQQEKRWIKQQINILASPSMDGRGYVEKGLEKAAGHIKRQFIGFGLRSMNPDSSYLQQFTFPVNTFPGAAYLKLHNKELNPGEDYIVHAASKTWRGEKLKVKRVNLAGIKDSAAWFRFKSRLSPNRAFILENLDTAGKYIFNSPRKAARELPAGLYIVPQHGKLTWTVATDSMAGTIYYVEDTVMPRRIRKAEARLDAKFLPSFRSNNVAAFSEGTENRDSFILFTAHYDHLGKMGKQTVFPGAHDNASGTSLMLYLAQYFAAHPQKYSIGFIAFSGEEAGLIGSKYYTEHPFFPLEKIKAVINLDMTGEAINGITVVNAVDQKEIFNLFETINSEKNYLSKILARSQTQNSDHYYFSAKGVPAVFIYANGTKPFYHDVFDKPKEITLEGIDGLAKLLIEAVQKLQ